MPCERNHDKVVDRIKDLEESQGGVGRHKCPGCAYEQGFNDAVARIREGLELLKITDAG